MNDQVRDTRHELARVGLLGDVQAPGVVPDLVLRSWRRSISNRVEMSAVAQRYRDVDTDTILCRAADPVMDRWQHHLADTGTTLFLSDRGGSIVARRTTDHGVRRRLDKVHAAEGFDYSEDAVGTNGLGTSMVEQHPVYIRGSEHYNDVLSGLACAAVPVSAPAGAVIGAISLGGPLDVANPLMLSLTREIGQQIEERLRATARPQDLALAMSFMRFKNAQRPTLVMDEHSLLANTPGLPYVSVTSHLALWEMFNVHDWSGTPVARVHLDGPGIDVVARRVSEGARAHYVLHVEGTPSPRQRLEGDGESLAVPELSRPTSALLVVEGPPGSGRVTRAMAHLRDVAGGSEPVVHLLGSTSTPPLLEMEQSLGQGQCVVLRRVEHLTEDAAPALRRFVEQHRKSAAADTHRGTLVLTGWHQQCSPGVRLVLDSLGTAERTQALADVPEQVPALVKDVLEQVDPDGRLTFSPAALQAFVQWRWPGNLSELVDTVRSLAQVATGPVIERRDLPQHLQSAPPRRGLSMIENAERDAIVRAMEACHGNKSDAAAMLGIGRTTLYRRLRQLGLNADEGTL
ncbi:sigma-54-dependent Fis family transcriptional regulator [Solicola sp. PLA-1-18]|uniref:sigma-54-dependent Fis family transcriptional regulator n=1 Tax=Solicola sp. PLA-1-18 TaxID=3380532 RepID=UPI003B7E120F